MSYDIRVDRQEAEAKTLPFVCMRCGSPAGVWKKQKINWRVWFWYKPETSFVWLPFCSAHKKTRRTSFAKEFIRDLSSTALPLLLTMVGVLVIGGQGQKGVPRETPPGHWERPEDELILLLICFLGAWFLVGCLWVLIRRVWLKPIFVEDIRGNSFFLSGVAEQFSKAVEEKSGLSAYYALGIPPGWVRVDRREAQTKALPLICVCCGAPASVWKRKRASWAWSRLPRKTAWVWLPFCRVHKQYWLWRQVLDWMCVGFPAGCLAAACVVPLVLEGEMAGWLILAFVLALLIACPLFIINGFWKILRIQVVAFRENSIWLVRVAEPFIKAVQVRSGPPSASDADELEVSPRSVRLDRHEAETKALPFICMRCGTPATVWKNKRIAWRSFWWKRESAWLWLPLCRAHKNHWLGRQVFNWSCAVFLVGCVATCFAFPRLLSLESETTEKVLHWLVGGFFAVFLLRCLVDAIWQRFLIRFDKTGEANTLVFSGVAEPFIKAVQERSGPPM